MADGHIQTKGEEVNLRRFARALAAAFVSLGAVSSAAAQTYSFGDLLDAGQQGPDNSNTWATLDVAAGSGNTYTFALNLATTEFTSLFGANAFVSQVLFNTPTGVDPLEASISNGTWGVSNVTLITNAPNPGGSSFDFGDCFGQGGNCAHKSGSYRLSAGESVQWSLSFAASQGDPMILGTPPMALHVQGIGSNAEGSAWYGVTPPIPEPETYAMLIIGLAVLGFASRRRKQLPIAAT